MPRRKIGPPPSDITDKAWEALYQTGDAGWDMGEPSPPLMALLETGLLPPPPSRVLVPGCGNGHELPVLAKENYFVIGVDFAPTAIRNCKKKLKSIIKKNHKVLKADLLKPSKDLRKNSVDWVFDQTFFCALRPEQREEYAKTMSRLIRPGGEIWALNIRTDYNNRQPYDCTPARYIKNLEQEGFELIDKKKLNKESHPRRRGRETLIRMTLK